MMGENNIGPIFVELQQAADRSLSKPFPPGAGHDKFDLGFQIASSDPKYAKFRSVGSMSWPVFTTPSSGSILIGISAWF
jgi:hypothetical protein